MNGSNTILAIAATATLLLGVAQPAMAHGNRGGSLRGFTNPSTSSSGSASNSSATAHGGVATATGGAGGRSRATASNANTNSANNTNNARGGSATASNNGNNNGNNNSSSSNSQRQRQRQSQSQSSDNSNSNNSRVEVNQNYQRPPVNTAYAASLVAGEDTCMGSASAGAQGVSFGLSLGSTWRDSNCRRLKNSRQLVVLGYTDAATALMCADDDVRAAMEDAGTPCPVQGVRQERRRRGARHQRASLEAAPTPSCPTEEFVVYFEWDRSLLTPEAVGTIDAAAARARLCGATQAMVTGHTDTSGSRRYNEALSARRSGVVRSSLIERGLDSNIIRTESRGETQLARTTPDNVRERDNRRTAVTIRFS